MSCTVSEFGLACWLSKLQCQRHICFVCRLRLSVSNGCSSRQFGLHLDLQFLLSPDLDSYDWYELCSCYCVFSRTNRYIYSPLHSHFTKKAVSSMIWSLHICNGIGRLRAVVGDLWLEDRIPWSTLLFKNMFFLPTDRFRCRIMFILLY